MYLYSTCKDPVYGTSFPRPSIRAFARIDMLNKAHDNGASQPGGSTLAHCLNEMFILQGRDLIYLIMVALMNNTRTNEDDIMIPSAHVQVLHLIKFLVRLRIPSLYLYVTSRLALDIRVSLGPLASHRVSHRGLSLLSPWCS